MHITGSDHGAMKNAGEVPLALSPLFSLLSCAEREAELIAGFPFKARPAVIKPRRAAGRFLEGGDEEKI